MTLDTTAEDTREAVVARLGEVDVFTGISAVSHKSADLAALLAELGTKYSVRFVVLLLEAKEMEAQTHRTDWQIDITVDVGEYPPLNQTAQGTRKGAWALAFTVMAALKLAPIIVNGEEVYLMPHPTMPVRELLSAEKWNAELLVVRVPIRLTVSGIPRPSAD